MINRERIVQWVVNRLPRRLKRSLGLVSPSALWLESWLESWADERRPLDGVDRSKQTP